MDSKFVKIENDNDMDNDTETKPTARRSTSATKLEKLVKILLVEGGCYV